MTDPSRMNQQLIQEISALQQRIQELEKSEAERKMTEQEMTILADIVRVIGSTLEIDKVYEQMATEIRKLIPFDSLMVNLRNAKQETLVVTYISGLDIPGRRIGDSFPVRGTIGEEAIRTKRGVVLQSENSEDLVHKFPGLIVSVRAGMRSIMTVPLIFQDEAIGNLIMRSKEPDTYSEDHLRLTEKIGIQIAGAITNAHLFNDFSKMEKALRESEANYRQLFENAPTAIYQIDFRTGKFLKANDVICEYLDCSQEEVTSYSPYEILTDKSKQLLSERLKKMGLGEQVTEYPEYEVIDKKGKRRCLQLHSKNIYNAEGLVIGADVVAHDITERKQAEEALRESEAKFRSIYEESPIGVELYDREGTLLDINRNCLEIFGISDASVVRGFKLFEDPNLSEEHKAQLRRGESVRYEIPFDFEKVSALKLYKTTKSGTIYLDLLITPFGDATKESIIGYLLHVREITERKQAEKKGANPRSAPNLARLVPGVIYPYRLFPDGRSAFPLFKPGDV